MNALKYNFQLYFKVQNVILVVQLLKFWNCVLGKHIESDIMKCNEN